MSSQPGSCSVFLHFAGLLETSASATIGNAAATEFAQQVVDGKIEEKNRTNSRTA